MFDASFWQTLPDTLRQPAAIAIFGSLIAHGIFFAIFPVLTASQPSDTDNQRIVSVVDLSPAERTRLPQTTTSQVPLPPIQTQKGGSIKQPPGNPNSSFFTNPFDPFQNQLPNSLPSTYLPPDLLNQPDGSLFSRSTSSYTVPRTSSPAKTTKPNPPTPPDPDNKSTPPDPTNKPTSPDPTNKPTSSDPANKSTPPDPANKSTPPGPTNKSTLPPNLAPPLESVKKEIAERQQYQYNTAGTTYADDGAWITTVYAKIPESQRGIDSKNEPLQASYDISYTLNPPPKKAIVQIVIDVKAQKLIGFNLTQKTGYPKLDEEALKVVQEDALKFIKEKMDKGEVKSYEIFIRGVEFSPKKTAQG